MSYWDAANSKPAQTRTGQVDGRRSSACVLDCLASLRIAEDHGEHPAGHRTPLFPSIGTAYICIRPRGGCAACCWAVTNVRVFLAVVSALPPTALLSRRQPTSITLHHSIPLQNHPAMGASYQKHAAKRQQKSLGQENTPDASPKSADDTTLAAPSPSPSSSYPPAQFKDYGHHGDEMLYATDLEDYGAETLEYLKEVEVGPLLALRGDASVPCLTLGPLLLSTLVLRPPSILIRPCFISPFCQLHQLFDAAIHGPNHRLGHPSWRLFVCPTPGSQP